MASIFPGFWYMGLTLYPKTNDACADAKLFNSHPVDMISSWPKKIHLPILTSSLLLLLLFDFLFNVSQFYFC